MTRPNRTTRSNSALGLNAVLATIRHALITWALLLGLVWLPVWAAFSWGHINRQTTAYERHVVLKWAEAVAWVDGLDLPARPISYGTDGAMLQAAAGDFARAPKVLAIRDAAWTRVKARIWLSAGLALLIVLCIRYMLGLFGQGIRGDAYLRGGWLTSPGDLGRLIRRAGPLSRFQLGKIRLSQESECQHLQIEGTPGTGKTVALRQLLGSIGRRWPAIIYDTKGEFLAESYDAERDVVLNPLDARCPDWTPWNEILSPTDAWRVAKAMVASQGPNDGFWIEAARQLLADFLLSAADDRRTNAELYRLCTVADTDELKTLLKGTPSGRLFADPGAERMRESVRNTLITSVRGLQLLRPEAKAGDGFSITQWVRTSVEGKGEAPRVFLFSPPDHAPAIAPIIAVWIESASAAVLGLGPSRTRRKLALVPFAAFVGYLKDLRRDRDGIDTGQCRSPIRVHHHDIRDLFGHKSNPRAYRRVKDALRRRSDARVGGLRHDVHQGPAGDAREDQYVGRRCCTRRAVGGRIGDGDMRRADPARR